ncbi:AAA family ATPase [Thiomicrorhabdus sp. zzn3]|uniref:AAA family ATPase n=1 Tax=Thiomicrorhabdus sp. zzn3 TaxID=3039775 RepID=UPI0024365D07|nr:AAA family ATPase [Thiomicrorhabdus sp. zzn3]MDG6778578.1 AAA family ATPase [Thiomicrorhabdus sp. zzn3]
MYKTHFGLSKLPFKNTPDQHFFYEQASRLEILHALIYVIKRGDAIVKVTGEVGCGKTTLLRLLADSLDDSFRIVYINSPNLTAKDLLFHIADELEVVADPSWPKYLLIKSLRNALVDFHAAGKQVIMLVDEAQSMSEDALEEIRLLSNIETDTDKLIQIVLFGQPELDKALSQHSLRQLKDRISYNIHVPALTPEEVQAYLNYRMRQASYNGLDFFNRKYSRLVHTLSKGLPRSINTIADQLLMAVYGSGESKLHKKHFKNISNENTHIKRKLPYALILGLVFIVGVVISLYRFEDSVSSVFSVNQNSPKTVGTDKKEQQLEQTSDTDSLKKQVDESPASELRSNVKVTAAEKAKKSTDETLITTYLEKQDLPYEIGKRLAIDHLNAEEWLSSNNDVRYGIQLSVVNLKDYAKAKAFYERYKMLSSNLKIVLDLNQNAKKYRVKFLYLFSDSYSYLVEELSGLPASVKKSQPFISPVGQVLKDLETTNATLSSWDMS